MKSAVLTLSFGAAAAFTPGALPPATRSVVARTGASPEMMPKFLKGMFHRRPELASLV